MVKSRNENRPFKVRKNGKTRGRSSKVEKAIELMMKHLWKNGGKEEFLRYQRNLILFGWAEIRPPKMWYGKGISELMK